MKRSIVDVINIIGTLLVVCVIAFAVYTLFVDKPFYRASSYYEEWDEDSVSVEDKGEYISEGPIDEIEVGNVSGLIRVEGWDEDYAEVNYIKRGPGKAPEVKIAENGSRLAIKAVYPPGAVNFGSIDFYLKVPSDLDFLKSGNVSGAIDVSGLDASVRQELSSTSGSVSTDSAGDLEISSVSGGLEFSASGSRVKASTTSGRIRGNLEKVSKSGKIELNSVSGRITLEVPEDIDADIDLHSVSGSVSSELPVAVTSSKRNSIKGVIGSGGTSIEMSTVSGAVKLTE